MFRRILAAAILLLAPLIWSPASAQQISAFAVANCGTPPNGFGISGSGYVAGTWYPVLQDTTGKLCITTGSGGGLDVTIAGPLGTQATSNSVATYDPSVVSAIVAAACPSPCPVAGTTAIGATSSTAILPIQGAGATATPINNNLDSVQDGATVTGTASSATTLFTQSAIVGYASLTFSFSSVGTSNQVTLSSTTDGTTATTLPTIATNSPTTTWNNSALAPTAGVFYCANLWGRGPLVATVSTYSSGTVTVNGVLHRDLCPTSQPSFVALQYRSTGLSLSNGGGSPLIGSENSGLLVTPWSIGTARWQTSSPITLSSATNSQMTASCGAGLRNYITDIDYSGIATTTAVTIQINDGASTSIWTANILAGGLHFAQHWTVPIRGSAATAMGVQLSGSPTGSVTVNADGFCAP